ncbi:MAG: peroxide stress protein YaaA, partial [Lentimicrobium sp.]|nr:peroxide stress protein YaaA [Lentimicrobium sp.]
MLIIISPSKTLDFESSFRMPAKSDPEFINYSKKLISLLKKKSPGELSKLMDISPKLAELNALRYSEWQYPFPETKARPALSAFKGDVYEGLKAWELGSQEIE